MRLSGGSRARQTMAAPKGKKTRPTGAKVREAMFDVLGARVRGARVLDLFAGSGALGFEAMSRGAASVVFVDNDASAVFAIRRNALRLIDDEDRWRILPMHAARALRTLRGSFDIVLIDPPYERGAAEELSTLMQRGLLSSDGIAVVEHRSTDTPALPASMRLIKKSKYGDTSLTFAGVGPQREQQVDERTMDGRRPPTRRS
jgi:16S rRNA (guanine966-N2)-methyltransferase